MNGMRDGINRPTTYMFEKLFRMERGNLPPEFQLLPTQPHEPEDELLRTTIPMRLKRSKREMMDSTPLLPRSDPAESREQESLFPGSGSTESREQKSLFPGSGSAESREQESSSASRNKNQSTDRSNLPMTIIYQPCADSKKEGTVVIGEKRPSQEDTALLFGSNFHVMN